MDELELKIEEKQRQRRTIEEREATIREMETLLAEMEAQLRESSRERGRGFEEMIKLFKDQIQEQEERNFQLQSQQVEDMDALISQLQRIVKGEPVGAEVGEQASGCAATTGRVAQQQRAMVLQIARELVNIQTITEQQLGEAQRMVQQLTQQPDEREPEQRRESFAPERPDQSDSAMQGVSESSDGAKDELAGSRAELRLLEARVEELSCANRKLQLRVEELSVEGESLVARAEVVSLENGTLHARL